MQPTNFYPLLVYTVPSLNTTVIQTYLNVYFNCDFELFRFISMPYHYSEESMHKADSWLWHFNSGIVTHMVK